MAAPPPLIFAGVIATSITFPIKVRQALVRPDHHALALRAGVEGAGVIRRRRAEADTFGVLVFALLMARAAFPLSVWNAPAVQELDALVSKGFFAQQACRHASRPRLGWLRASSGRLSCAGIHGFNVSETKKEG